ncbi:MAG: hypothetical protein Q9217_001286 [Psora testacea]
MIIYKDIVTGDEIISDTYNLKDIDDVVYEVDCKMVTKGGVEVNIGANASAEEQEEVLEEQTDQVIDVVDGFRMTKMAFGDKKQLAGQIKGYLKKAIEKMKEAGKSEEEIKKFQSGVQGYFTKKIAPKLKDWDCYASESMDPDGMLCFLNYREDGITPYMIIWKHALTEMKV